MLEVLQALVGLLVILSALFKAVSMVTGRIDKLTNEIQQIRESLVAVVKDNAVIKATYVTEKECSARREELKCQRACQD